MEKNDKYSEELEKLNKRIAENPNDANAFLERAIFYFFTKNDRSKAIDDLDKMIDVGNNTKNNMYGNRALFNFFMNKYNEALNDLNKADKIIYYIRGGCYYSLGKYNKAIQDFNKAIKLEPEFGWNYSRRGHCYYILDKYEKAINDFSKAIEINTKSELDYDYRGRCYFYIDKYEKAINDFSKAIEINTKSELHYDYRGRCYFYINKYDRANHDFNKVLGINPEYKNEDMYLCYGDTLTCLGKFDEAIKNYKLVLEKDPKNETAKIGIAIAYYKIKKYDKIYKYLKNIDSFNVEDIGEENFKNLIEIFDYFEKDYDKPKAIDLYKRTNPFDYEEIKRRNQFDGDEISVVESLDNKITIYELYKEKAQKEIEYERALNQTKIEERDRIIRNQAHNIKNILRSIINPLKYLQRIIHKPQIEEALKHAEIIREMVNATSLSYSGSKEDFIFDAKNNDKGISLKEMIITSIESSVGNILEDIDYYSNFWEQYFPDDNIYKEALQEYRNLHEIPEKERFKYLIKFINKYMSKIDIKFRDSERFILGNKKSSGVKMLALFNDLISNAIKYTSFVPKYERFISIKFFSNEELITLKVESSYKENTQAETSGIGNLIIDNMIGVMDGKVYRNRTENNNFIIEIKFSNFWKGAINE